MLLDTYSSRFVSMGSNCPRPSAAINWQRGLTTQPPYKGNAFRIKDVFTFIVVLTRSGKSINRRNLEKGWLAHFPWAGRIHGNGLNDGEFHQGCGILQREIVCSNDGVDCIQERLLLLLCFALLLLLVWIGDILGVLDPSKWSMQWAWSLLLFLLVLVEVMVAILVVAVRCSCRWCSSVFLSFSSNDC